MNYTSWEGTVYYMGETILGSELPWHYLFVWIGITVPGTYYLLAFLGLFSAVRDTIRFVRRRFLCSTFWFGLFLLLLLIIPFGYVLEFRPVLYHGWRHFFFIYPVIICFSILGLDFILPSVRSKAVQIFSLSALATVFLFTFIWIQQNRCHEYLYFNSWIRSYAMDNFELDYWYLTESEHLNFIRQDIANGRNRIDSPLVLSNEYAPYRRCFTFDTGSLFPQLTDDYTLADYVITWEDEFPQQYLFEEVNPIWISNTKISSVYKRAFKAVTNFEIFPYQGSLYCNINNASWEIQENERTTQIIIALDSPISTDSIAVFCGNDSVLDKMIMSVSTDGESWYPLTDSPDLNRGNGYISVPCVAHNLQYISIQLPSADLNTHGLQLSLYRYETDIQGTDKTGLLSISSIDTNSEGISPVRYMIDSDSSTRWTSPGQTPGLYIQFNFLESVSVSAARLSLNDSPWDYPSDLEILASADGETWFPVDYTTPDNQSYFFAETIECQHIRFQLGEDNNTSSNWSVYEAQFFTIK